MSYAQFEAQMARVNDVLCAINILVWDARTQMPAAGTRSRGHQVATLTGIAREMMTGDAMRSALDSAESEIGGAPHSDLRRTALAQARDAAATLARIPQPLMVEAAELKTNAQQAWVEARSRNDFAGFAPYLERTFAIQREVAEAIGYSAHPYDAMIGQYEPGMTSAQLAAVFDRLRVGIRPLLGAARARGEPRVDFLSRAYPVPQQREFGRTIATRLGFDFDRSRLDDAVHPFEISFTRSDVRITSRFRESWLPGGLFALWHEAGHGMYEQGVSPDLSRSVFTSDLVNLYAVGGTSFGMHESQSRLWENRVGRSRRFWDIHFDELRAVFPDQLTDVSAEEFWRGVNVVRPSLIRVEADELTYDLHIMLRAEIEMAMMSGDMSVADLQPSGPEKMRDDLGLEVPNDTLGVLQDVHWSTGYVGSFPTYTLGNIMASQLFAAATERADVAAGLEGGDYAPLKAWLNDNVHSHGRSKSADEILRDAAGGPLDPEPYLSYLAEKFG